MAFPSAGIGRSGGARVIYLYSQEKNVIYLVTIYGKSSKKSLIPMPFAFGLLYRSGTLGC